MSAEFSATGDLRRGRSESIRIVRCELAEGEAGSRQVLSEALRAHRRALASGVGVLKDGRRSAVTRVQVGNISACVKEYRANGVDRLKDRLRVSRAERAWRAAHVLAERGIATPEPMAVVERGGTRHLLTRYVTAARPLDRLLLERFAAPLSALERLAKLSLLHALGGWVRRIHDQGIYHGDWSAKNVLAVESEGVWSFLLLDLESVAPGRRLTTRRRAKNLGQLSDPPLDLTPTDLMRFLLAYAGGEAELARGAFPRAVLASAGRRRRRRERRTAAGVSAGDPPGHA